MKKINKKLSLSKSTLSNLEKKEINGGIVPPRSAWNACYVGYVDTGARKTVVRGCAVYHGIETMDYGDCTKSYNAPCLTLDANC